MKNIVLLILFFLSFFFFVCVQDIQVVLVVGEQVIVDFFVFDVDVFGVVFVNDGWLINFYGMCMNGCVEIS